jgi:hypothetical protein
MQEHAGSLYQISLVKLCKRGHEQIPENLIIHKGHKRCRPCQVARCNEWRKNNRGRHNALRKTWMSRNPDGQTNMALKSKFGITLEQYNKKFEAQKGLCAICGNPEPTNKRLAVDHDHETEEVRDLLCSRCNPGLGSF